MSYVSYAIVVVYVQVHIIALYLMCDVIIK